MDERLRFVARLLEGEKMAPLCAEFGISRKTGYKIYDRDKDNGVTAFTDRSRRPYRQANRLPAPIEATIVRLKREYPGWGAPKIREKLRQRVTPLLLPAISTVHAVLDRHGLVHRRRHRRPGPSHTALSRPTEPNALWCADYKGEFMLGNRRYCYPLTITDFASRYLLTCEALSTTQERFAFTAFDRAFKSLDCRRRSAPTRASHSQGRPRYTGSANSPCGGSAWGFRSNASHPDIPSKTAGTNACIGR